MAVGGSFKLLGLGAGITGIALGGSPGMLLTTGSLLPSAIGGGLLVTGSWLRARHQGWYDDRDYGHRVRSARRVGWALVGSGAALLVGSSVAFAVWPFGPMVEEGAPALYPRAFMAVGSLFVLAPLLIGAGSSAVTWSSTYPGWRARKLEIQPTVGGLSVRF